MSRKQRLLKMSFVLGLIFLALNGNTSSADTEPEVTLSTLVYSENVKKYEGDVIALDGKITSVGFVDNKVWVVVDDTVSCYFKGKEADKAYKNAVVGNRILLKGRGCGFNTVGGLNELSDCCLM